MQDSQVSGGNVLIPSLTCSIPRISWSCLQASRQCSFSLIKFFCRSLCTLCTWKIRWKEERSNTRRQLQTKLIKRQANQLGRKRVQRDYVTHRISEKSVEKIWKCNNWKPKAYCVVEFIDSHSDCIQFIHNTCTHLHPHKWAIQLSLS